MYVSLPLTRIIALQRSWAVCAEHGGVREGAGGGGEDIPDH